MNYCYKIIHFLLGILIVLLFILTIDKFNLTLLAKKDLQTIDYLIHNNLSSEKLVITNSFGGTTTITQKKNSINIVSNNIPYQGCMQYGLYGVNFNTININGTPVYRKGEFPVREKILNYCLVNEKKSTIEMIYVVN